MRASSRTSVLRQITSAGADALFRALAGVQLPALKWLADGSYLPIRRTRKRALPLL
jgi:hypothetical protein